MSMLNRFRNRSAKPKIFLIGFNKCGTSTLHSFLAANGIRSVHWSVKGVNLAARMALNISKERPVLDGIDRHTAYSDLCFQTNFAWIEAVDFFRTFHAEHPDAYFVLNDRDVEHWIASRQRHPDLMARAKAFWKADEEKVKDIWRAQYQRHKADVLAHFAGHDRFIVFDIENDSPSKLVSFLSADFALDATRYGHRKSSAAKGWTTGGEESGRMEGMKTNKARNMTAGHKPMKLKRRLITLIEGVGMLGQATSRRLARNGAGGLLAKPADGGRIVYVDAGLHKTGQELVFAAQALSRFSDVRLFGFEANPRYFAMAQEAIDKAGVKAKLFNLALVGPDAPPEVTLNVDTLKDGLGDSIIRTSSGPAITVPADRLSRILQAEHVDPGRDVILLRMNIEGAEVYVLEDLVEAGLLPRIDGFFGSWDDPEKIGGDIARRYRQLVTDHAITHPAFNGKELRSGLKRRAIAIDLETAILNSPKRRGS